MNGTQYRVSSIIDCDNYSIAAEFEQSPEPLWRQAVLGCRVLQILRDLYHFNVTYVYGDVAMNITNERVPANTTVDLLARPMALTSALLDTSYPILPVFTWRLGFLVRRRPSHALRWFYSQPFTRRVWNCLYLMTVFIAPFLYFMCWCEQRLLGTNGGCSLGYELLVAIGAYCQRFLPVESRLQARRLSYVVFFLFSYLVYTYYGSVLLSHQVNEKTQDITLEELIESDYEYVFPGDRQLLFVNGRTYNQYSRDIEGLNIRPANITDSLKAMMKNKTAVLSDFESVYPFLRGEIDSDEICKLMEINVYSNIKKYFFTAKNFSLKEDFRIGLLRAKEAGLFHRLISTGLGSTPRCSAEPLIVHPQAKFIHVLHPLMILLCTYVTSIIVVIAERVYYQRKRVYPFVK